MYYDNEVHQVFLYTKMRTSYYCIPIDTDSGVLLFDTLSKVSFFLPRERYEQIYSVSDGFLIDVLSEKEKEDLKSSGFLVDDSNIQQKLVVAAKHKARLQKRNFHIIVNPTLDCNLRCWYCYESHIKDSRLTPDVLEGICHCIEIKYLEDNIETLQLSLFGGEPLLAKDEVNQLLHFAEDFCKEHQIKLSVDITTNGTLFSSQFLSTLVNLDVAFQITLDGERQKHDSVRCTKGNAKGTYDTITKNILKVLSMLPNARIRLRINYDAQTLNHIDDLLSFVGTLDRGRVTISMHKVWQVNTKEIDEDKLLDFLFAIKGLGFYVDVQGYPINANACYADCLNSCVVNYNGDVYKCTARSFDTQDRCGYLTPQGIIVWDYDKLKEYCFCSIPTRCKVCKLLPICSGICSQQRIEKGDEEQCILDKGTTIEDVVLMRYYLTTNK